MFHDWMFVVIPFLLKNPKRCIEYWKKHLKRPTVRQLWTPDSTHLNFIALSLLVSFFLQHKLELLSYLHMILWCGMHIQMGSILSTIPFLNLGKSREKMSAYQIQILTKKFKSKPYLSRKEKFELAKLLNISNGKITDWFWKMRFSKIDEGFLCDNGK